MMPREAFDPNKKDHRMIRIYVGLEDPEYLIKDLTLTFDKAS
jgi:cystathionine beta-lyase/cystathionine gamma-synthase